MAGWGIVPAPAAMPPLVLAPAALALAVLGAHFYRAQWFIAVVLVAFLYALFFVRARWAGLALQAALVLGAIEWIRTAASLVAVRESMGQPWTRMAIILGAVALATAACALAVRSRRARRHFGGA